jgi:Polyketide cyclase / dehydrase and lipid transport
LTNIEASLAHGNVAPRVRCRRARKRNTIANVLDITASATTSLSPEQVIRAAADFTDRREKVWRNAKAKYLVVHDQGADFAEVTEGLRIVGVFWERSRYDWSQPGTIHQTVIDSNVLAPGSTWELTTVPRNGGSGVEMRLRRDFRPSLKGKVGSALNHLGGARGWGSYLRRALAEAQRRSA